MTTVDTREEAEKIGELYGITLAKYDNKIAVYDTDKDPYEVIEMGQEQGWPRLFINYNHTLMEEER